MRSKWSSAILYLALLLVLGGCYEFDNPVDPAAPNYNSTPEAPRNLRWDGNSAPATILWDAVTGADDYLIEYYEEPGSFSSLDTLSPTQATFIADYGPSTGKHHYQVFARNENGSSPASNELVFTLP